MAVNRAGQVAVRTAPTSAAARKTVLVVDDDPSLVALLRAVFEENGYHVVEATNGKEAIVAYCAMGGVDLVVSDIDMPTMDGLTMCRWLGMNGRSVPVIVISGLDLSAERVGGVAPPVAGFLRKPFAVTELLKLARATETGV